MARWIAAQKKQKECLLTGRHVHESYTSLLKPRLNALTDAFRYLVVVTLDFQNGREAAITLH